MCWIGAPWAVAACCFVLVTIIRRHGVTSADVPSMVFLAPVAVASLASVGGLLSSYSTHISARLAVPVLISSFFAVGISIFLATNLSALLLHRLFEKGFPPPSLAPGMFFFVGPLGQSATALQGLASAARSHGKFAGYHKGTAAASLDAACVLIAMMLSGFGLVWLLTAFWCMGEYAASKQLSWTPTWNAIVFPTGTLITSMLMFSIEMDSPFFRTITTIGLIFLVIMWFVNLSGTVWMISKGQLLIVKENWRAKQELEQQKDQNER